MKEVHKSGNREFFYTMLWALGLLFAGRMLVDSMPSFKIFGSIATLIAFCILGFFVLTRYSARFTYENTGHSLRINQMIGKRNKEIEFNFSDILSITSYKPADMPKPVYNMRVSVFSDKKSKYIIWGYTGSKQTLVFEPSDKFMSELKKSIKADKKKKKEE